jgi:small subunit ribosomal protein S5
MIEDKDKLEEKVVQINRITRVVAGGRRIRFRAVVVVGDKAGRVGVGVSKGLEVVTAIQKASQKARKSMIEVQLRDNTIPHEVMMKHDGAKVFLKPASKGTGLIAGGPVRAVVEAAGIQDILSKMIGSSNKVNNVYATFEALKSLKQIEFKEKTKPENNKKQVVTEKSEMKELEVKPEDKKVKKEVSKKEVEDK